MTEEEKAAIDAMSPDERKGIRRTLAKSRHDNACALICSLVTLADRFHDVDLPFIESHLPRINDVHARHMRDTDNDALRRIIPVEEHCIFTPFRITRCEWRESDGHKHLTFFGDVLHADGEVRELVIVAAASPYTNIFGR